MADPVAEKSGFLKMYMSNHPDTLVGYAKWYGKVQETIKTAEMTAIDCKTMTLTCTLTSGHTKVVVVPIEPPLKGYDDVKPRLLEMKAKAQEGLGMIKAPKITTITFPRAALYITPLVLFQVYCYFLSGSTSSYASLANLVTSIAGQPMISFAFGILVGLHTLETAYTISLCRKHSTGLFLGAQYVVATMVAGFPIISGLRNKIQQARIDSVMKIQ